MKHLRIQLAILCVLFVGSTPIVNASDQGPSSKLVESKAKPSQSQQINAAIRKTRTDPDYTFFVVCMPEDKSDARAIHKLWSKQAKVFSANNTPVFFVRGANAQEMLRKSYSKRAPAYIAFRRGNPWHTRSGFFKPDQLNHYINLAINSSSPPTYGSDQLAFVFQDIDRLIKAGKNNQAAKRASEYTYTIHLLTNQFISSYTSREIANFFVAQSMAEITLAELYHKDPSVAKEIKQVREIAKSEWEANGRKGTMGIGFWMETAFLSDSQDEVVRWVKDEIGFPSTVQVLKEYGHAIVQELIKNEQWQAVAYSFRSVDFLKRSFEQNQRIIERDDSQLTRDSVRDMNQSILNDAAIFHGALLAVGRDDEAWEIVTMLTDFVEPPQVALAICNAAMKTGAITDQHMTIAKKLNPKDRDEFFKNMKSASVSGPQYD